jgi:cytochrome b
MGATPKTAQRVPRVYVWDRFVRIFHWALALAFTVAFFTEGEPLTVHVWAGYGLGVLVLARCVWGVIGTPHARFSDLVYAPSKVIRYVRDLVMFRGNDRHVGHSPGGGAMVVLLFAMLAAVVGTGLVVYGGEEQAGPLAGMVTAHTAEVVEAWHELLANITLVLIFVHIAAVVLASFVYKENLVGAMVSGYKRR